MTRDDAQKLLDEIATKLGEHANAFTLFAEFEEDPNEGESTFVAYQSRGSLSHIYGLAQRNVIEIEHRIFERDAFEAEPRDPEDDE